MKKERPELPPDDADDEMLDEYRFDYSKAKPNRFAERASQRIVTLDPDVAAAFDTPEAVNEALRSLIGTAASERP
jgi:hypothetical protein